MTHTAKLRHVRYDSFNGLERNRRRHTKHRMENAGIVADSRLTSHAVASFTNATNLFTITGVDTLADGTPVVFTNDADDMPDGLVEATLYWLNDAGTDQYTCHATKADAIAGSNTVTFADDGTGNTTMWIIKGNTAERLYY